MALTETGPAGQGRAVSDCVDSQQLWVPMLDACMSNMKTVKAEGAPFPLLICISVCGDYDRGKKKQQKKHTQNTKDICCSSKSLSHS